MFEIEEAERPVAKIKIIGVGGAGTNAVNTMISAGVYGVEFIAVNTDIQHLEISLAPVKVQIGKELTRGLGAGSDPELGKKAALEDRDTLISCIEGADLIFITAGMGGGTGTGAAPVIASLAKELGILTVAVVTKPFYFEGKKRLQNALLGVKELKKYVDTIILIPNDRIHMVVEKGTPLVKSFAIANDILRQAVQGISDLILSPGFINRDFADVKTIIEKSGKAVIGLGSGTKGGDVKEIARRAINNPLLEETSIEGARRILINITGGFDLTLDEVQEIASTVYDVANEDANIIFGTVIKPDIENEVFVTVIATGFEDNTEEIEIESAKKWLPKDSKAPLKETRKIISKNMKSLSSLTKKQSEPTLFSNLPEQKDSSPDTKSNPESSLQSSSDSSLQKYSDNLSLRDSAMSLPESTATSSKVFEEAGANNNLNEITSDSIKIIKEPSKDIPADIEDEIDIPAYLRKNRILINEKNS